MIIGLLLYLLAYAISIFFSLLPASGGLPADFETALVWVINEAGSLNGIFPVGTVTTVLILGLLVEAGILAWNIVNWFINKVRGSGG